MLISKKQHLKLSFLLLLFCGVYYGCSTDESVVEYELNVTLNLPDGGSISPSNGKYEAGTSVEISLSLNSGFVLKEWTGDASGQTNPLTIVMNSDKSVVGILDQLTIESIAIENSIDTITISNKHKYSVFGTYSDGEKVDLSGEVRVSSNIDNVTILDDNSIVGAKSGDLQVEVTYDNFSLTEELYVNHYEEVTPHDFLQTPADNYELLVPVVIINYLPTKNGLHVNQETFPIRDYGDKIYEDLELSEVKNWIISNDIKTKYSIEEGSKFRTFNGNNVRPYVGIKVVKEFTFYEISKVPNPDQAVPSDGEEGWYPDYYDVFEKINLENLVNVEGVKEVWFNSKSLSIPESNMSSPSTGDISNSYKIPDDLPIYNKTYVVYGNFIHRWYAENLHNRGHQIEAQLAFIDKNTVEGEFVFWNKFVGTTMLTGAVKTGRSGDTHFPPNGEYDYDYDNSESILSDIGDWKPDNLGEKREVNNTTWKFSRTLPVQLPTFNKMEKYIDLTKDNDVGSDAQGGWLIYWFQSIPGMDNNIPYSKDGNSYIITNWWEIFYNWDEAIQSEKTLWE